MPGKKSSPAPTSNSELLSSSLHGGVLKLVLSDPKHGNALSLSCARDIRAALGLFSGKFEALTFEAAGRFFCAGGNLADHASYGRPETGLKANREIAEILDELSALAQPKLAMVSGDCLGGGIELLACFDIVLAVPEAGFGFWQRRLGLSFGWGGGARLLRRLPKSTIDRLALDARFLSAREAKQIGLIDEVVLRARLNERARERIEHELLLPQNARAERAKNAAVKTGFIGDQAAAERASFEKKWLGPEHRAALKSRGF